MIKINFVTQNLAPFRVQWLKELGKYCEVNVFHNGEYEKDIDKRYITKQYKGLNIYLIKHIIFKNYIYYYNFLPVLKSKEDILILDGYGFSSQQILIVLLKMMKKKYVLSLDGGILKKERRIKYWIKKKLISGADAYFSTSECTDYFLVHYGAKKDRIYRHFFSSVTTEDIAQEYYEDKEELRRELNIENKITIIAVGRFIERKGFDILLKALPYIKWDVQVLFVGGQAGVYEGFRNGYNPKTVRFLDFCEKDKLKKYYQASDIFVLPTREDIWGLVIGEAFAMGLPVITTERCLAGISMIKDRENGFIIPVDNEKILAKKIDALAGDEALRRKIAINNINSIKKYAIDHAAVDDMKNIRKIIQNSKGKSL